MLHQDRTKMLEFAEELLNFAEREYQRPEEDAMTFVICTNSRQSLANYLGAFLHKKKVEIKEPISLVGLLEQCKSVDERFSSIDLQAIACRCEAQPKAYCLNHEQVDKCMEIAQEVREVLHSF